MSVVETIKKRGRPKKEVDADHKKNYMKQYMKTYYNENKVNQQLIKKNYYYKSKKNMPSEYNKEYGELASSVFKIHALIDFVRERNPNLIDKIKEY